LEDDVFTRDHQKKVIQSDAFKLIA
jgi:hypothetical protein